MYWDCCRSRYDRIGGNGHIDCAVRIEVGARGVRLPHVEMRRVGLILKMHGSVVTPLFRFDGVCQSRGGYLTMPRMIDIAIAIHIVVFSSERAVLSS